MEKYIKIFYKNTKKLFIPMKQNQFPKFKKNNIQKTTPLSFKYKNSKIKFYIIRRTPGAGLFSNFIFVLNSLKIVPGHVEVFRS